MTGIDEIKSNFELLDDWEDRYRYVIELGRHMQPFPEDRRIEANKVRGCASQVWLTTEARPASCAGAHSGVSLHVQGDSDAHIVKGLIAILIAIYEGRPVEDLLGDGARDVFAELGLKDHLSPQRSNGLAAMVDRLRADARAALPAPSA